MQLTPTQYRVCYADTDQMGVVYYGNYAKLFEIGRGEAFREIGTTYKEMENTGVIMPVIHLEVTYHSSAFYDDLLTIETTIDEFPKTRVTFNHKIYNEKGKLLVTGSVTLCFIDKKRQRPVKMSKMMEQKLREIWND
ncbi:acyl-CoA thioester hydrolase [Balneicella halophila]|uniref:Acyl-CoA thioester hydrolase n=1 Tax=Balneicella halophila TaxID=1537566 RepID=A0A7L4UPA4_BALHA|nr:thioesterase family protein [Balneicella halophila]PVX50087.1 acyl-CoA thioester hydrolase [Balneicella halophila]